MRAVVNHAANVDVDRPPHRGHVLPLVERSAAVADVCDLLAHLFPHRISKSFGEGGVDDLIRADETARVAQRIDQSIVGVDT
jgi:hypothetical protein